MEVIEIEEGSGNVFADLGLPKPAELRAKSKLLIQISKTLQRQPRMSKQVAKRMGISIGMAKAMARGEFSIVARLSIRRLKSCVLRLNAS
jgi:predicted XRE-type DNA-binding protein